MSAKMKPEFKAAWVEALRSGKYKQGQGCLRDAGDEYCCLGVLADTLPPSYGEWEPRDSGMYSFQERVGMLEDTLFNSLFVIPDSTANTQPALTSMNDDKNLSFAQIADYIEENL